MISRSQREVYSKLFANSTRRAFSNAVAPAGEAKNVGLPTRQAAVTSLWQHSRVTLAQQAQKRDEESAYLADLRRANEQEAAFTPAEISSTDGNHLRSIKQKINSIVAQELESLEFRTKVSLEDLSEEAYQEVLTKKNYYFGVDEQKKNKNLKVYNTKAPGNKHHKPQYILPHEHVDVTNYVDLEPLDSDKLLEVYGYYSYLIDMHIAQVRPDNLDEFSYVPARFNQENPTFQTHKELNNLFFNYYHRWREPTRTWFSQTQELDHADHLKNRPTTTHYDHDKGEKWDVEWRDDQKFPHVADRLGYPILREEPIERIFGIERAPAHPGYQFQPFVQTPSMNPDPTLSFRQGETIYENRRVVEWVRFWKALTVSTLGAYPGFYVFECYQADGLPSLSWMADNFNWWQIPQQFQDGGGWGLEGMRYCDDHEVMNIQYGAKRAIVRPVHTAYVLQLLAFLQYINIDYVSKMVYNKDKDLVFIYKPDGLWNETEYVYEMHHLEQMVPFAVTAIKNMSMQQDDGILTVYDMRTRDNLKFYGEDKYWNLDLKDEFMANTRNLWRGNFSNKYRGSIFHQSHKANEEQALTQMKVDRELEEAIAKHGEAVVPSDYKDDFFAAVDNKKKQIAATF